MKLYIYIYIYITFEKYFLEKNTTSTKLTLIHFQIKQIDTIYIYI